MNKNCFHHHFFSAKVTERKYNLKTSQFCYNKTFEIAELRRKKTVINLFMGKHS